MKIAWQPSNNINTSIDKISSRLFFYLKDEKKKDKLALSICHGRNGYLPSCLKPISRSLNAKLEEFLIFIL